MGGMKLYYSNGSCSLASHIALEEAGAKFEAQRINLREGEQLKPEYLKINPKHKVPALQLDDGVVITENPAIISYVADTHPQAKLLAAPGELARAKAQEWLAWCASTVHISFGPLFRNKEDEAQRQIAQPILDQYDQWLRGTFVLGEEFSVADAYTLVFTGWARLFGLKIGDKMRASAKALLKRDGVKRAVTTQQLKFENL
ncbi:MAG: Glyoxalase family protein [bacterium]|nr:Glyoxalase family protein [bacterium]